MSWARCLNCKAEHQVTGRQKEWVDIGVALHCPTCNRDTAHEAIEAPSEDLPDTSHQELVEINGKEFLADPEMIPLLKALNDAGLETRTHCSGHGGSAWVTIRIKNINSVEVRNRDDLQEVLLDWKPPPGFAKPEGKS
jgi:hypothetical protein